MKKIIGIVLTIIMCVAAHAQKQNIQSASNYYREKDYTKALEYIDKAVVDPSTDKDPKAWFLKGVILSAMQEDAKMGVNNPYVEAVKAYMKVVSLKADYEKDAVDVGLLNGLFHYYNDGIKAYNDNKYDMSFSLMKEVVNISTLENNKRFQNRKGIDTIAADAKWIGAYSAWLNQKFDDALPILLEIKNNPICKKSTIYSCIIDIYKKQNKDKEFLATLDEAKKAYPNDDAIRTEELNYYIKTGQQDVLFKKLEESATKEPNNDVLSFDLATYYQNMAFPKKGKKPDNYSELVTKAETYFNNALRISPENSDYHYNYGALIYNEGIVFNDAMNAITGTSASDMKKYEDLKKQRDALFDKSLPHLEKVYNKLDPNVANLKPEEKGDYYSAMVALKQIYAIQSKLKESTEMKKKIDAFKTANAGMFTPTAK
jgi:Tfp pilus assembly protein PilF